MDTDVARWSGAAMPHTYYQLCVCVQRQVKHYNFIPKYANDSACLCKATG